MGDISTDQYINVHNSDDVIFFKANLNATIFKEKPKMYVAHCETLDLYSQGETLKKAEENIKEATYLFIQSCIERNTLDEVLKECGFHSVHKKTMARKAKLMPKSDATWKVAIPAEFPMMIHG